MSRRELLTGPSLPRLESHAFEELEGSVGTHPKSIPISRNWTYHRTPSTLTTGSASTGPVRSLDSDRGHLSTSSTDAGPYRVRHPDRSGLEYIGETGRDTKERFRMLTG